MEEELLLYANAAGLTNRVPDSRLKGPSTTCRRVVGVYEAPAFSGAQKSATVSTSLGLVGEGVGAG